MRKLLLTGASGFVGRALEPSLRAAGFSVHSATRRAREMRKREPGRRWVELDVDRPETLAPALAGMQAVVYLIHSMAQAGDYEARERAAAQAFIAAAADAGVDRLVYLGGVAPAGRAKKHLRSRLMTGDILRSGTVAVIELRAGMIIGAGGLSWQMVRDLAARLPFMILPRWLSNVSQPVALTDVVAAIVRALTLPPDVRGAFDLPGPETLTGEEILRRIGRLLGVRPYTLRVPVLTPRLSSYWLKLVTRADLRVAQQLVDGLTSDLVAHDEGFWAYMPDFRRTPFDEAAERALLEEDELPLGTRALEWALQHVGRRS
jgi:uncharacterized protein YbjT (DUF2867 family)